MLLHGHRGVDLALASECHVVSKVKSVVARAITAGNNDADNSGTLRWRRCHILARKRLRGNELNGIAMNAVGSGTTVENIIKAHSVYDYFNRVFWWEPDVINYVALYVKDDSLDIDEGYRGTITNALIIQSETDGNRCVESDGVGSYSTVSATLVIASDCSRNPIPEATILNGDLYFSATRRAHA